MKIFMAILGVSLLSSPVFAQDHPLPDIPPGNTRGGDLPGSLTQHDVAGKRLLNANGAEIGHISGVDQNGNAIVRTGEGHRSMVPLSRLSKGTGPNTVIESSASTADHLNRIQAGPSPDAAPPDVPSPSNPGAPQPIAGQTP